MSYGFRMVISLLSYGFHHIVVEWCYHGSLVLFVLSPSGFLVVFLWCSNCVHRCHCVLCCFVIHLCVSCFRYFVRHCSLSDSLFIVVMYVCL